MAPDDRRTHNGRSNTVDLEQWAAAKRPRLGEARRNMLFYIVAADETEDVVTTQELCDDLDLSRKMVDRNLRALESQGLVRLVKHHSGQVSEVSPTSMGLRVAQRLANDAQRVEHEPAGRDVDAPPPCLNEARGLLGLFLRSLVANIDGDLTEVTPAQLRKAVESSLKTFAPGQPEATAGPEVWRDIPVPPAPPARSPEPVEPPRVMPQTDPSFDTAAPAPLQTAPDLEARQARPAHGGQAPPRLSAEDAYAEGRLEGSCARQYKGMPWYERTRLFSDLWDRQRRARTGELSTFFTGFGPRWEHPCWPDFNKARREADEQGADYDQWLKHRMDCLCGTCQSDFAPHLLAGGAIHQPGAKGSEGAKAKLGKPPYTFYDYDPGDPTHTEYARRFIDSLLAMAPMVFGDGPDEQARMLAEAVSRKRLPIRALDLVPGLKRKITESQRKGTNRAPRNNTPWNRGGNSAPPIII